jgi:23S rRNA (adenine2503-C2)-methyltransferase
MAIDLFGLTLQGLCLSARESLKSGGAGTAKKIFCALYARGEYDPAGFGLNPRKAGAWLSGFSPGWLEVARKVDEEGEWGLTSKAVLSCADGGLVECVLIPMPEKGPGRASLCVSSQIGCRMGCAFCQTGGMGLSRNLSPGEIVSQVMTARFKLGWAFSNLVFMGMGEPLDNAENLIQALRVITDQAGLHVDGERITVCTSGPPGGIERFAAAGFKRMGLSISLNAAIEEKRDAIMPVNRGMGLARLQAALKAYPQRKNFVLGVNYCLLPGLNDSPGDAVALADFCQGLGRALVNVIPYNPGEPALTRAPAEEETEAFIGLLKARGLAVRRRATKGRSIMAACGQLGSVPGREAG